MKYIIIAFGLLLLMETGTNAQNSDLYFGKKDASIVYLYFENDIVYLFDFLINDDCTLLYSIVSDFFVSEDTIKTEEIGNLMMRKNKLILKEKYSENKIERTVFHKVKNREDVLTCLLKYGVTFKNNKIKI